MSRKEFNFQGDLFSEGPLERPLPQYQGPRELTVGEMFSGPGGIGLALNQTKRGKLSFKHLWATDYDSDTCETYRKNIFTGIHKEALSICKDIREVDIAKELPQADGFLYGFPCNDFSNVGESKGLEGHFGPLFSYGVEYININNPLFFFAENVSGLRSANEGNAFKTILKALNNAGKFGYNVTAHLYKFEQYGIPQARHRFILIGIRGDLVSPKNGEKLFFKVPKAPGIVTPVKEALKDIPDWASNQERTNQSKVVIERLKFIRPGENVWQAEDRMPEHLRLKVKGARLSQIYRRLDPDKPAYTVTGSGGGGTHTYHWEEPRALTNRERARIQTFPDDFEFVGSKESVRKQIGMAVPPQGASIILDALLKTLAGTSYASEEAWIGTFEAKSL